MPTSGRRRVSNGSARGRRVRFPIRSAPSRADDGFFVAERASQKTAGGSGLTEAVTVASTCNAGNTIVLIHGCRDTSTAGISVADSRGNTWTIDSGVWATSNNVAFIASTRQNVGTLQAGDTVTITFGTAPTNRLTLLEEFKGLVSSGYTDATQHTGNSGSVATGTTGATAATAQASEVAVAGFCSSHSSFTTYGYNASGTTGTYSMFPTQTIQSGGSNQKDLMACYQVLTATGAQTAVVSWTPSSTYQGVIVTYKAT